MLDKPLLKRAFTTREKGLLLVLVVILAVAFYYFAVIQNVSNAKAQGEQELLDLQAKIEVEKNLAESREAIQQEMSKLGDVKSLPQVGTYDNIRNEFNMLNGIFKDSDSYTLTFQDPQLSGSTVRRVANISFEAPSYEEASELVEALESGAYRCQVNDVNMTGKVMADGSIGSVSVSLVAAFFETTDGASSLSGLQSSADKSSSTSSSSSSSSASSSSSTSSSSSGSADSTASKTASANKG